MGERRQGSEKSSVTPRAGSLISAAERKSSMKALFAHRDEVGLTGPDGGTALHAAAEAGSIGVTKLLIAWGERVGAVDSKGSTALHRAVEKGHEGCVKVLMCAGADPDATDVHGVSPRALRPDLFSV